MNIKNQIDEIFEYFKEDCSYSAIIGTIFSGDINPNEYEKIEVEEFSFDHVYQIAHASSAMDDYWSGQTLIPIDEEIYLICEWTT